MAALDNATAIAVPQGMRFSASAEAPNASCARESAHATGVSCWSI
jgi:hypothetical protein